MDVNSIISISGAIIGFLAILIVAVRHRQNSYQKFLLLLFLFCLTYTSLLIFLTQSGWILKYPHLYRTSSPLVYAASISIYLFGIATGKSQDRFPISALFWFMIPLLHFLELLPFFLSPAGEKIAFLEQAMQDQKLLFLGRVSLLPNSWHYMMQLGLGILLMGIMFTKTLKYRKQVIVSSRLTKLIWLNRISLFLFISNLFILMLFFVQTENFRIYSFGSLFFTISLLIVFLSIFLEPGILYGTLPVGSRPVEKGMRNPKAQPEYSTEEEVFKERLEIYFRQEKGFLDPQFRQQDLADYLDMSRNELSHCINSYYKKNFNQLLNDKRIEVALQNLDNSGWEHLSLQGIAREVGFKSRTTFNKAFKNKTGLTPSEYKSA